MTTSAGGTSTEMAANAPKKWRDKTPGEKLWTCIATVLYALFCFSPALLIALFFWLIGTYTTGPAGVWGTLAGNVFMLFFGLYFLISGRRGNGLDALSEYGSFGLKSRIANVFAKLVGIIFILFALFGGAPAVQDLTTGDTAQVQAVYVRDDTDDDDATYALIRPANSTENGDQGDKWGKNSASYDLLTAAGVKPGDMFTVVEYAHSGVPIRIESVRTATEHGGGTNPQTPSSPSPTPSNRECTGDPRFCWLWETPAPTITPQTFH